MTSRAHGQGSDLDNREMQILERIESHGAMTCTGSCLRRKPSELHCRNLATALRISDKAVWRAVNSLVEKHLLEKRRDEERRAWKFTPTDKGKQYLTSGKGGQ